MPASKHTERQLGQNRPVENWALAVFIGTYHLGRMRPEDILDTYEAVAPDWDAKRDRSLFERSWLDRFLAHAPGRKILDLGCGAGRPIAAYLAERSCQITGVDGSQTMTELFTQNLPDAEIIHADMRGLDLGRKFDGIVAWDSFFHLNPDDQREMFATFADHANDKAVLLFTTGHKAGVAIGEVHGRSVYHSSFDQDEYEDFLQQNGFKVLHFVPEDPTCAGHTVWLARFTA